MSTAHVIMRTEAAAQEIGNSRCELYIAIEGDPHGILMCVRETPYMHVYANLHRMREALIQHREARGKPSHPPCLTPPFSQFANSRL